MQQLEPDMEQQTVPKMGKVYVKAVYCHPAYLTYNAEYIMRNAMLLDYSGKHHLLTYCHELKAVKKKPL